MSSYEPPSLVTLSSRRLVAHLILPAVFSNSVFVAHILRHKRLLGPVPRPRDLGRGKLLQVNLCTHPWPEWYAENAVTVMLDGVSIPRDLAMDLREAFDWGEANLRRAEDRVRRSTIFRAMVGEKDSNLCAIVGEKNYHILGWDKPYEEPP